MLGTAFPAARVLLVEQPGPWGRDGLRDSRFDRDTARELERQAGRAGVRVQAIRRPGRTEVAEAHRSWALADARPGREALHTGTFEADADLLDLPLDGTAGTADPGPVYLVCAHGQHDVCCAVRGRPVAAALQHHRPGRVWETSHLGGDRFAANVLVLPAGHVYGRVLATDVAHLVSAVEAGEVLLPSLRGRIGLPPVGQAALAYAHERLGVRRAADLRVETSGPVRDGVAVARVRGPAGEVDVTVRVTSVPQAALTCANPGPNRYLAYQLEAIEPVA